MHSHIIKQKSIIMKSEEILDSENTIYPFLQINSR